MQFKGINDGILVKFHSKDWEIQHQELINEIVSRDEFFHGAKIILDFGSLTLRSADLGKLREELSSLGLILTAIISLSQATRESAMLLGMDQAMSLSSLRLSDLKSKYPASEIAATYYEKDIKKGEIVESNRHVIVFGDIHAGAELISAGNVIVWGKILGAVHAGNKGDERAIICALHLMPTYIQIAQIFSTPTRRKSGHKPEMAIIQDGKIIVAEWKKLRISEMHNDT